jgi:hypothetical protein
MAGKRWSVLNFPLTILFGVSIIIFLYTAGYSWYVGGSAIIQSVPWLYSSIIISGASIFVLSNLYYSRKLERISSLQRLLLAFFDLAAFFSIVALAVWGLVFPILRPITNPNFQLYLLGQKSLAMGLYTGLVLCSVVIVYRIALQLLIARSNSIMIISSSAPPIENTISVRDSPTDGSLEDKISSIHMEITRLREEIASLSAPSPALRLTNLFGASEMHVNNRESPAGLMDEMETLPPALTSTFAQNLPGGSSFQEKSGMEEIANDEIIESETSISESPNIGGPQIPDSARDNPWASVLSRRQPTVQSKPIQKRRSNRKPRKRVQKEKPSSSFSTDIEDPVNAEPRSSPIPNDKQDNSPA